MNLAKFKTLFSNSKGQTMVEYTLLILVVVLIINGLFKILNERLIDGPNSLQNSYLGAYQKMFTGHNASFQGQYKNFTIRR